MTLPPSATAGVGLRLARWWGLSLLLPILFASFFDIQPADDAAVYWELGSRWAATGHFGTATEPHLYWPVGYPAFVAAVCSLFGAAKGAVVAVQLLLFAVSSAIAGAIALRAFGERVAGTTMLLYGLQYDLVTMPAYVLSENVFIPLLLGGVAAMLWAPPRWRWGACAFAGVLWGLATLVRGNILLLPGFLVAGTLLWWRWDFRRRLRGAAHLLVLCVAFAAAILPWSLRNHRLTGVWTPVSYNSGEILALSHNPYQTFWSLAPDDPRRELLGLNEPNVVQRHLRGQEIAKKAIAENPGAAIANSFVKLWFTFTNQIPWFASREILDQSYTVQRSLESLLYWQWTLVLLLTLGGVLFARVDGRADRLILLAICAYWLAFHATMMIVPRYRFPVIPFFLVYAAFFIEHVLRRLPEWRRRVAE